MKLLKRCFDYVEERIRSAENAITSAKEASQDDTKSSAGDKYETTREMMQQEVSRNEAQLYEAGKLKHVLSQISANITSEVVQNGSLVITNYGNFFIAISAGQIEADGLSYYAVSAASPIGKKLAGLKKGDQFAFTNKEYEILEVY